MNKIKAMTEEEWNKKWPMGKIHPLIRHVAAVWGDAMNLFIRDRVKLAQDMLEATEKYRLEYAEQEAISFAEWMSKYDGRYLGDGEWRVGHLLRKTTAELYNLYKQTIKP